MIWRWLKDFFFFLLWLILPPPPDWNSRRINPQAPCPACGNPMGKLMFERVQGRGNVGEPKVKHICGTCGFMCYEDVIAVPKMPAA